MTLSRMAATFTVAASTTIANALVAGCDSHDDNAVFGDARTWCGSVTLGRYDETQHCLEALQPPDICITSTTEIPSASLGQICAYDPAGHVWLATLRGDQYLHASGWRFDDYRVSSHPLPPEMQATTEESLRCNATVKCAPACAGNAGVRTFCPRDGGVQ